MPVESILAAVDIAHDSQPVLARAVELAERFDANLGVLTVVRPLVDVYGSLRMAPYAVPNLSFEKVAMDSAKQALRGMGAEHRIAPNDLSVRLGHPAHEIVLQAQEMNTDLLIMGMHSRHSRGMLLGSTTNAVIRHVPCNLFLVKYATLD